MSIAEIRALPVNEKLLMMEVLWEELRTQADDDLTPPWHKELLDARRKAVAEGREEILDWDEIKHSLGAKEK